jgi:nitrite reductase/ring-hydroxylating ferredoxin subunit
MPVRDTDEHDWMKSYPRNGEGPPAARPVLARRGVLRALWVTGLGALVWAWGSLASDRGRRQRELRVTVPRPTADGISLHGEVILLSQGGQLTALHARCPHLGCRIDRVLDGVLVCPCHGSRFEPTGKRTGGPATSDLRPLRVLASKEDQKVDIELPG